MITSTARSAGNMEVVDAPGHYKRTSATADRLMHHAHVCVTPGDSVRLQQATTGKGVKPLT